MSDVARLRQRRPAPKVTYKKPIIKYDDLETEQELDEEQSIVDTDRIKNQKKYINFVFVLDILINLFYYIKGYFWNNIIIFFILK